MAEFTRFSETILTKQDQRVVSITVKPMISDCTGRIYFTDLMVQEGDRLTGYVIHTETLLQKYRENGAIVPPRFYNGVVRSAETVVLFNLGSDTAGLDCYLYPVQDMAAGSISVALGAGAHKAAFPAAVSAGDELALLASSRKCLLNGSPTEKRGFFQYTAAGDSKHPVTVSGSVELEEKPETPIAKIKISRSRCSKKPVLRFWDWIRLMRSSFRSKSTALRFLLRMR